MAQFNAEQTQQLLAPVHPRRVMSAQNQSFLPHQDVIAHLIRVFGFGGFDITHPHGPPALIFEDPVVKEGETQTRWTVGYKAFIRLDVKNAEGEVVASYEEGSTGDAINQPNRTDAHDLAMKSALSTAKKRAAIHLGDQFGLSLYNKGQLGAYVMGTKVLPEGYSGEPKSEDVQSDVPQNEADGIDETQHGEPEPEPKVTTPGQDKMLAESLGATPVANPANTPDDAVDVSDSVPHHPTKDDPS